jgi:hypothetical protein
MRVPRGLGQPLGDQGGWTESYMDTSQVQAAAGRRRGWSETRGAALRGGQGEVAGHSLCSGSR